METNEKERLCRYLSYIKSGIKEENYGSALQWIEVIQDKLDCKTLS